MICSSGDLKGQSSSAVLSGRGCGQEWGGAGGDLGLDLCCVGILKSGGHGGYGGQKYSCTNSQNPCMYHMLTISPF